MASKHEVTFGKGRHPNFFNFNSTPPEPMTYMDHEVWRRFRCHMNFVKANKYAASFPTACALCIPYAIIVFLPPLMYGGLLDQNKSIPAPTWWVILLPCSTLSLFVLSRVLGKGHSEEYREGQRKVVLKMKRRFASLGYSTDYVYEKGLCGVSCAYVRFSPLSGATHLFFHHLDEWSREMNRTEALKASTDFNPDDWMPLEGTWEYVESDINRNHIDKRLSIKRQMKIAVSPGASSGSSVFRMCHYYHTTFLKCFSHKEDIKYEAAGNALVKTTPQRSDIYDDRVLFLTRILPANIAQHGCNADTDPAFYRGPHDIWKVEASTLIIFKNVVDEMLSDDEIVRQGLLTKEGRNFMEFVSTHNDDRVTRFPIPEIA